MRIPTMAGVYTLLGEFLLAKRDLTSLLPEAVFLKAWRALVGEPPATMLEDRSEMIRILVESSPLIPLNGVSLFSDG